MLLRLADNRDPSSLASRLRAKRNFWFQSLAHAFPRPFTVLDVGGTETVWKTIGFANKQEIKITILNVVPTEVSYDNVSFVLGDGRNMHQFEEKQFDVVYSNSVIEHVGDYADIRRMAEEVRRVGKRYFLQTPNRYFPIEPHFVFPFFQFLPRVLQTALVQNFSLGWIERKERWDQAAQEVESIRLLSYGELSSLFPDGKIEREKIFGLTKSLIAHKMSISSQNWR